MRRPLVVLAAALLLQFTLISAGHTVGTSHETEVTASTERGVRVAGHEVPKVLNPGVLVAFDVQPDLVGVSTEEFGPGGNPIDPLCAADHDPLGAGTVNMNVVADLQAGASGQRDIAITYTEEHDGGSVIHNHEEKSSEAIGPVGPAGEIHRVPICIYE